MTFTAEKIASFLQGTIEGNPGIEVSNIGRIEDARPGDLSFLANPKYEKFLYSTNASIVLINKDFQPSQSVTTTLIRVDNAYQALASLLEMYQQQTKETGIDSHAFIDTTAVIGTDLYAGAYCYIGKNVTIGNHVKIYPQVYIGDHVVIGDHTELRPGVKIYRDCKIGAGCTLHSNVVIGGDGFGFAPQAQNNYKKVPQVGNVVIEDNVEIGAGTTIDRATLGSTIIRKGVKLDNLIMIAHNVEIGENTVIAAQSGVSGSTKIGRDCMIGGQVGIVGHLTIADGVKIAAQSGISSSITEKDAIIQGSPAFGIKNYQKSYVVFKNLPDLSKHLQNLEKELEAIKKQLPG